MPTPAPDTHHDPVTTDRPTPASRRDVLSASLTLGVAVGVFGVVFGVGAVSAGGSVAQACVMSVLVFTGASQFSVVSVIASGGSTGAALGGAMLLAARNTVYGVALAPLVGPRAMNGSLARRLVAAHLTIDETTAMATAQRRIEDQRYAFWATGLTVFVCWNVATLVGALAGSAIDPQTYGLDAAFPAGFVVMVAPHMRHRRGRVAGLFAAVICVALIPVTPIGVPILCAALAILVGMPVPAADDMPDEPIIP